MSEIFPPPCRERRVALDVLDLINRGGAELRIEKDDMLFRVFCLENQELL